MKIFWTQKALNQHADLEAYHLDNWSQSSLEKYLDKLKAKIQILSQFPNIGMSDGKPIEIHNKLKYENITPQFEWFFDEIKDIAKSDYEKKDKILGKLITTEKPLKPGLRGITLFANGRMANSGEFFGRSESSHFYSYLTGWLDVDYIDDYPDDYISTDRQSLNWENEVTNKLKTYLSETLKALEQLWRKKERSQKKKN